MPDRLHLPDARLEECLNLAGFHYPAHAHDELFLTLTLSGNLLGSWQSGTNSRRTGAVTIIPTGAIHSMTVEEASRSFQVVLGSSWVQRYRIDSVFQPQPLIVEDSLENWFARRLYNEFRDRDPQSGLALECALHDLIEMAIWKQRQDDTGGIPGWINRLDELLRDTLGQSITATELAQQIGVDPAYMMRKFRSLRNCTIGEHVRRLRLERACRLLASSDVPIGDVAQECGFSDHSHLTRQFRTRLKVTPTIFRDQGRG